MTQVIGNAVKSIKKSPRPAYVMYFNPRFAQLWEDAGFRKVSEGGEPGGVHHYRVYSWPLMPPLQ